MRKNILIIVFYILGMFGSVGPVILLENEIGTGGHFFILAFIITYTVIFVLLLYFIVNVLKTDFMPFIRRIWVNLGLIIGLFAVAFISSIAANILLMLLGVEDEAANQGGLIDMIKMSEGGVLVILILLFCLIVPILEELVFRKALYGFVKQLILKITKHDPFDESGRNKVLIASLSSVVISGLIFGLIHISGDFIYLLHYGTMGIILGFSYFISRENIYVPLGIHIIQNVIGVAQIIILIENGML